MTSLTTLMNQVEKQFLRPVPEFSIGDTVKVEMEITEGDKKRLQAFEGAVMKRHGHGTGSTVTLRKVSGGVAVEKILPLHLPSLKSLVVLRRGKVRRAKLYYLRGLIGKSSRIDEMAAIVAPGKAKEAKKNVG